MIAAIWSAIGVLTAGLFATIFYLGERIDSRYDALATHIDAGFARLDSRIDWVGQRLDNHIERHV
jgi:hypothetical protein